MSAPVSGPIAIGALDLAALLCSRVCHDLISPVGAIVNGIEVMEEDKGEETKASALDLIKKSAYQASAKLRFCRLAFGAGRIPKKLYATASSPQRTVWQTSKPSNCGWSR